jgi:hypothetical protein
MVAVKKESVDSRRLKVTDRFFMRGVRVRGSLFFNSLRYCRIERRYKRITACRRGVEQELLSPSSLY